MPGDKAKGENLWVHFVSGNSSLQKLKFFQVMEESTEPQQAQHGTPTKHQALSFAQITFPTPVFMKIKGMFAVLARHSLDNYYSGTEI